MTILAILAGSLIIYFALATPTAILIGRSIRLADRLESPAVGAGAGKASPDSGARHLRSVQ